MKRNLWKLLLPAGLALAALAGCGKEKAHYDEVERKAVEYYKDKYGDKVTVVDGFKAGNSGLFGYIGVDDRAYEMSDGAMVYWNEGEQYFADNRQAEEIVAALKSRVVEPAVAQMDPDAYVSEYSFNRTGMDSFDEMVFRGYFDGDLEKFTAAEEVRLGDFGAVVHESAYRAKIEEFFNTIDKYLGGYAGGTVVVCRDEFAGEWPPAELLSWPEGNLKVRAVAYLDLDRGLKWLDNAFIELADGVQIMSGFRDLVLEPGDVTLEPAGAASDLQKKLDVAYCALPLDAEENKNGGYSVRDRRHESRVILTDPEAPIYRLCFSDSVRGQVTEEDTNYKFYILMDSPEVPELWRYIEGDRYGYTIFMMGKYEPEAERGRLQTVNEGDLLYFGGVTFEKYGE